MIQSLNRILLYSLILVLCINVNTFSASDESLTQFVVYFEGGKEINKDVTFTIDRIELIADDYRVQFQPVVSKINSYKVAARQFLFLEELVEPKKYSQIKIYFSHIEVIAERAKIYPKIDSSGYTIDLNLEYSSGATTVLFLGWSPQIDHYEDEIYQATFQRIYKTIPPIGSVFFVSNEGSNNITVIDRYENKVVDVIRTGIAPREMVYAPINNQLIVSNTNSNTLSIIDAATNKVIKTITHGYSEVPVKMLLAPDQQNLFLLNKNSNTLTVLDLYSFQEKVRIYLDNNPFDMVLHEFSGNIYITYELSRQLSLYNIFSNQLVTTYELPLEAATVAVNERNENLYYAQPTQRSVSSFSSTDGSVASILNICGPPVDMVYNSTMQMLYASVPECREILLLKPSQNIELGSIETVHEPGRLSFDIHNGKILFPYLNVNKIAIYNIHNRQMSAEVEVGKKPYMILVP